MVYLGEEKFDDADAHLERAKLLANNAGDLARATMLQGLISRAKGRLEEAETEVLRAMEALEEIGANLDVEMCRDFLGIIHSDKLDLEGESSKILPFAASINPQI